MKRNWTYEEQGILIDAIITALKSDRTIREGMKDAAARMMRTPSACAFHFYTYLHGSDDPRIDELIAAKRAQVFKKISAGAER